MSSHFDLTDFRLFANVAEARSLTAGAERTNLSTPAASLRIRHLEESLGSRLFRRTSQGTILTGAGEACLRNTRTILETFEQLKADVIECNKETARSLRIVVNSTAVNEPLPRVMRDYMQIHPDIYLALEVRISKDIIPAVLNGDADIGIGGRASKTDGIESMPYLSDRLVLIMSPRHPLAKAQCLRFSDALDHPIIALPENSNTQLFMRRAAEGSRKPMNISVGVSSYEAMFQMVEAGIGIGVISERIANLYRSGPPLTVVPLKDKTAFYDIMIGVPTEREMPPHARTFVEMLQEQGAAASRMKK